MEELSKSEFKQALKDVRTSYRLLAIYQRRLLDTLGFVVNSFNTTPTTWHGHFSGVAKNGRSFEFNNWSWDWLPMYLIQFKTEPIVISENKYFLQLVHVPDSGFYDARRDVKLNKIEIDQFQSATKSKSQVFFVFSKNDNGNPLAKVVDDCLLNREREYPYTPGDWVVKPYDLEDFYDEESTLGVIGDFKKICNRQFDILLS
jgi:hypothetical protein